jgi:hypothetical protein
MASIDVEVDEQQDTEFYECEGLVEKMVFAAEWRRAIKKILSISFLVLGSMIIALVSLEIIVPTESYLNDVITVNTRLRGLLRLIIVVLPVEIFLASLHYYVQGMDDLFARSELQMYKDPKVIGIDKVKIVWQLMAMFMLWSSALRVNSHQDSALISKTFLYFYSVIILQLVAVALHVAFLIQDTRSYILEDLRVYERRASCLWPCYRDRLDHFSVLHFLKKGWYRCKCTKRNYRRGRFGRRRMKAEYAVLQEKIDTLTGQPGWRTNPRQLSKAKKYFFTADLFRRRLHESKEHIIAKEEQLVGTKRLLERFNDKFQLIEQWKMLYVNYQPDKEKHSKRLKRAQALQNILDGKGPRKPIKGLLVSLQKEKERLDRLVQKFQRQFRQTFLPWKSRLNKALKKEEDCRDALNALQALRRNGKTPKIKTSEENDLRQKIRECVDERVALQSSVHPSYRVAMPVAYEKARLQLAEIEHECANNLVPVKIKLRMAQMQWNNLRAYRAQKTLRYEKKTLEKLYKKRVKLFAENKRKPQAPKTAPVVYKPPKATTYPDATCVGISWQRIPEKKITGYSLVSYVCGPNGKYTMGKHEYIASPHLKFDSQRENHYAAVLTHFIPNTKYKFRVSGHNDAGEGGQGPASNSHTTGIDLPEAVTSVAVTDTTERSLSIQWNTPESHGIVIEGYTVNYKTKSDKEWKIVPHMIPALVNRAVANLKLTGLAPGTKYIVQVHTETMIGQKEGPSITSSSLVTKGKKRKSRLSMKSRRESSVDSVSSSAYSSLSFFFKRSSAEENMLPSAMKAKMSARAQTLKKQKSVELPDV